MKVLSSLKQWCFVALVALAPSVVFSAVPVITSQPTNQTVSTSGTAHFSVTATGSPTLFYQWYFDSGTRIPGANSSMLTLSNVQPANAGSYFVIVSNTEGVAISSNALLNVTNGGGGGGGGSSNTPPVITQQSGNQTVAVGGTAQFSVTATGSPTLFYQWYFGSSTNKISGATSSTLTLSNVQPSNTGNYFAVVSNAFGSASSSNALLTVTNSSGGGGSSNLPPSITQQPSDQTVTKGGAAHFSVTATGSPTLFYQWYFGSSTNKISGATSSSLTLSNVQPINVGDYFVIVSNSFGSATSSRASLTLTNSGGGGGSSNMPPVITQQPGNQAVAVGATAQFSVTATGSPTLFYQWYFGSSTNKIFGATTSTLTLSNVQPINAGNYFVVVSNQFGSATSSNALLTITNSGGGGGTSNMPPAITQQPSDQTVTVGGAAHFSVTATGSPTLFYQWYFASSTNKIAGANSSSLTLSNVQPINAGDYFVIVSNSFGSATSARASLTVTNSGGGGGTSNMPPVITQQPSNQTVSVGGTAHFTAAATGSPTLRYQWFTQSLPIPGAINSTLTLSNVQPSSAGNYFVIVSNLFGYAVSSNAVLTVGNTSSCTPPASGIAAWWPGEGNGNDIINSNNAILEDGVTFVPGKVNQAFELNNPTNGFMHVPASASLNVGAGTGMTMEGWINVASVSDLHPIAEWYGNARGVAGVQLWVNGPDTTGALWCALVGTNGERQVLVSTNNALRPGVFQHVALTYDPASGIGTLYINGFVAAQSNVGSFVPQTTYDLWIGHRPFDLPGDITYNANLGGALDEFSLYNRALSQSEIQAIFNAGSAGKCTSTSDTAPVITQQPTDQTVATGGTAHFSVTATGSPTLFYQWYFASSTNKISGATGSTLTLSNVQPINAGNYFVVVSNAFGSATSSRALLTVTNSGGGGGTTNLPPAVTQQPTNQTVAAGSTAIFSVTATGSPTLRYQWYRRSPVVPPTLSLSTPVIGATNSTLTLLDVQPFAAGYYFAVVSNAFGSATSSNALLTVAGNLPGGPTIIRQPTNETVSVGGTAHFTVLAASATAQPLFYQWYFDHGTRISGATMSTLTLSNVQPSDAGSYYVIVSNAFGSVTSTNATLTVVGSTNNGSCTPPPNGLVAWWKAEGNGDDSAGNNNGTLLGGLGFTDGEVGQAFNFTNGEAGVQVPASSSLAVQSFTIEAWINPDDVSDFHPILEYAADTGLAPVQFLYGWNDPAGTTPGALFGILRGTNDTALVINSPGGILPPNQWSHVAMTFDFASQRGTLYLNGNPVGSTSNTISGLIIPQTDLPVHLGYRPISSGEGRAGDRFSGGLDEVSVYNRALGQSEIQAIFNAGSDGKCTSSTTSNLPPVITHQPTNQTVAAGSTAHFSVTATGSPTLFYQWYFRSSTNRIFGATSSTLTLTNVQSINAGNYFVVVSNAFGSATSSNALLTVTNSGGGGTSNMPPVITQQPMDQTVTIGGAAHFSVTATGSPTLFYQWYFASSTGKIAGATGSTLTLSNVQPSNAGLYFVTVSNTFGSATSGRALLTVTNSGGGGGSSNMPPVITQQPSNQTVTVGGTTHFSVTATGSPTLRYQWLQESLPIPGAITSTLTLSNVQPSNAGNYSVIVSNLFGYAVSSNAVLTVVTNSGGGGGTNPPPTTATVQVVNTTTQTGTTFDVPIILIAKGNENALSFSLNFDTSLLSVSNVVLGADATNGIILVNNSQAASGNIGVALALSSGQTFNAGTQQVARVIFHSAAVTSSNAVATQVRFTDQPITRLLSDAQGHALSGVFLNGTVTITSSSSAGLEGDASPRPSGDGKLNIYDWVQIGRFVAGLDTISNSAEFQRVDCAPRETLGDGQIKVTDWVQAGRYAAGLDPATAAGGPTGPTGSNVSLALPNLPVSRQVNISSRSTVKGMTTTVPITLQAQGNEGGLAFSLNFDPTVLRYVSTENGSATVSAYVVVNTNQASAGKLAVVIGLSGGNHLPAGLDEIAKVTFVAIGTGNNSVTFADDPIARSISDANATEIPANYVANSVIVNPQPTVSVSASNKKLSWPAWAGDFKLQSANSLVPPVIWTDVPATLETNGNNIEVTLPTTSNGQTFYRLSHP